MPRHFLRDDDLSPEEQAEVLAMAADLEDGPVLPTTPRGATWRRGHLRQELHEDPVLVRDGHRAARRSCGRRRWAQYAAWPRRNTRGHRKGVVPLCRSDRLAHLRTGAPHVDGSRCERADRQRALRRVPSVPGSCRPSDTGRAQGRTEGSAAFVLRRRRQQHGALADDRRRDGGHRRHHRRPERIRAGPRSSSPLPRSGDSRPALR